MTRGKVITAIFVIAALILLFAVFRSCRSGTRPPAERGRLEGATYRTDASTSRGSPHALKHHGMQTGSPSRGVQSASTSRRPREVAVRFRHEVFLANLEQI